jgi:hypothetical protein
MMAGVVDQHIQTPVLFQNFGHDAPPGLAVADVQIGQFATVGMFLRQRPRLIATGTDAKDDVIIG